MIFKILSLAKPTGGNQSQVSVDRWLISIVTERVEFEKNAQLLKNHSESANYPKFDQILARVPTNLPIAGDELE